jgi:hypothetical protein
VDLGKESNLNKDLLKIIKKFVQIQLLDFFKRQNWIDLNKFDFSEEKYD